MIRSPRRLCSFVSQISTDRFFYIFTNLYQPSNPSKDKIGLVVYNYLGQIPIILSLYSSVGVLLTIKQNYLCCGKGGKVRAKPPIPRL